MLGRKSSMGQVASSDAFRKKRAADWQRERALAAANPAVKRQIYIQQRDAGLPPDVRLGRKFRP